MSRHNHRANKHRASVIERDGKSCYYCGKPNLAGKDAQLDHLVAIRDGGKDTVDNLVLCCTKCNAMKGPSTLEDYVARRLLQIKREKQRLFDLIQKHQLL